MNKKTKYDGELNYNKVCKPTCLYIKYKHKSTKNPFLAGRLKIWKRKQNYDDKLKYNKVLNLPVLILF